MAVPTQPIPGYNETFLLCTLVNNQYKPIDNIPLYLDHDLNQLVPVPLEALDSQPNLVVSQPTIEDTSQQQSPIKPSTSVTSFTISDTASQLIEMPSDLDVSNCGNIQQQADDNMLSTDAISGNNHIVADNAVILNIEGQQIILDAATFSHLLANPDANTQLITDDGTEFVLSREALAALVSQQVVGNSGDVLGEQQLQLSGSPDIIANFSGSVLYGNDQLEIDTGGQLQLQLVGTDETIIFQPPNLPQPHLTPPITAHTSETNALLDHTPIMSPLEKPMSGKRPLGTAALLATTVSSELPVCRPNLEDSLAVIGVTSQSSSPLELPITVTNPAIATKVTMTPPTELVHFQPPRSVATTAMTSESRLYGDPGS